MNAKSSESWRIDCKFVSFWMIWKSIHHSHRGVWVKTRNWSSWCSHVFNYFGQLLGKAHFSWIDATKTIPSSDVTQKLAHIVPTLDCRTSREPSIFLDVCSSLVVFFAVALVNESSKEILSKFSVDSGVLNPNLDTKISSKLCCSSIHKWRQNKWIERWKWPNKIDRKTQTVIIKTTTLWKAKKEAQSENCCTCWVRCVCDFFLHKIPFR